MKELINFFDYLSGRIYSEPDLNDITWALCNVNNKFNKLFLNFCFKDITKKTPEIVFLREKRTNKSQPDFYFLDNNGTIWIIETKIEDKDFHFKQYRDEFGINAKCTFIAKYDVKSICENTFNFSISTWDGFIEYLEKNIDKNDYLIKGYLKYLKNIVSYLEVKDMDLNKITSLPDFNRVLEGIERNKDNGLDFNNSKDSFFKDKFGRYFKFDLKIGRNIRQIEFWIGIYFCWEEGNIPYLCFEIDISQDGINSNIKNIELIKKGKYFFNNGKWENIVYFELNEEPYDELFSTKTKNERKIEIITCFVLDIVNNIKKAYTSPNKR